MSAFFDLSTFDENRQKAAEMKRLRQGGQDKHMKSVDWGKVKEEKRRKRNLEFMKDV